MKDGTRCESNLVSRLPRALRAGDLVGIFAPSLPASAWYPERFRYGIEGLKRSLGVEVYIPSQATEEGGFTSGSAKERAQVFRELVCDSRIKAIFTTLGGFNSAEILEHVVEDELRRNLKILIGYSDATSLLIGVHALAGWCTFYGPAAMTQFGEFPTPHAFTVANLRRVLMSVTEVGELEDPPEWTNEFLDWGTSAWCSRARTMVSPAERSVWRSGYGRGVLFGGNLETLNLILGTPFVVVPSEIVLFWEVTDAEAYLPRVQRALTQLRQAGIFDRTRAMLIGRSPDAASYRGVSLKDVVLEAAADFSFPIVADLPFGHTDPMVTIPIGVPCEVAAEATRSSIAVRSSGVC